MVTPFSPDSRPRGNQSTADALRRAGIDLALEDGFDNVTVDLICERAGVSRRTFFNYFGTKDQAFFLPEPPATTLESLNDAILACDGNVLAGLAMLIWRESARAAALDEDVAPRQQLLREQPAARIAHAVSILAAHPPRTVALVQWLQAHPDRIQLSAERLLTEVTITMTCAYGLVYAISDGWKLPLVDEDAASRALIAGAADIRAVVAAAVAVPLTESEAVLDYEAERPGLRQRKRRATENAIELAATHMAWEHGYSAVTVDAICEAAMISRRTFFNYFPTLDAAITGRPMPAPAPEVVGRILETHRGDLLAATFDMVFASAGHSRVNTDVARLRLMISAKERAAMISGAATVATGTQAMVGLLTAWLQAYPDTAALSSEPSYEAALAFHAAFAAFSAAAESWLTSQGDHTASISHYREVCHDVLTVLTTA